MGDNLALRFLSEFETIPYTVEPSHGFSPGSVDLGHSDFAIFQSKLVLQHELYLYILQDYRFLQS